MRKALPGGKPPNFVLHINDDKEFARAKQAFDSYLAGARLMSQTGYRQLLKGR